MMSAGVNTWPSRTIGGGRIGLGETFDPAEAAAGRARKMPSAIAQRRGARFAQPHPQFDPGLLLDDLEPEDIVRVANDALGQAEAEREVFQILRRRHHDGV